MVLVVRKFFTCEVIVCIVSGNGPCVCVPLGSLFFSLFDIKVSWKNGDRLRYKFSKSQSGTFITVNEAIKTDVTSQRL